MEGVPHGRIFPSQARYGLAQVHCLTHRLTTLQSLRFHGRSSAWQNIPIDYIPLNNDDCGSGLEGLSRRPQYELWCMRYPWGIHYCGIRAAASRLAILI